MVSFGDSLSDVGTYAVNGSPPVGPLRFAAGRYTTNPGAVWTELVAAYYGDRLTPALQGGFGDAPVNLQGLGFAQGGARVSAPGASDYSDSLAQPLTSQLDHYLSAYGGFNPNQLILLQGGGNDIIHAVIAAAYGYIPQDAVAPLVAAAATDLARLVDRVAAAGGQNIAVLNMSDIGASPFAVQNPDLAGALSQMTQLFNDTLQAQLGVQPKPAHFVLIDAYGFYADALARYRQYGFQVANTDVACSLPAILNEAAQLGVPDPQAFVENHGWALLCSASTLVAPQADQTYMFADHLHPASRMQALLAGFVEAQLSARGI
ncbi:acylhydrolase [Xylophilus rhododendri]|uniref:Acylhydrolase n=1 Tax=Xylophilus rhododendri TaxID=2697032 RepID=A0A857JC90_9BURK|nr:SGNH/GDSL hydrolase family protein [Xylophilus rhododendri]QHJ00834.1 acylhydrolase [Xylophilus rhododendri]